MESSVHYTETAAKEEVWLSHRDIIIDLFDNKNLTLPELRSYMKENHNLEASIDQYKNRLHRKWCSVRKSRKYNEEHAMRAMAVVLDCQAKWGHESNFKHRGKYRSPAEVQRYWKRKKTSIEEVATKSFGMKFPKGLEVCQASMLSMPSTPHVYMHIEQILWLTRKNVNDSELGAHVISCDVTVAAISSKQFLTCSPGELTGPHETPPLRSLPGVLLGLWQGLVLAESESQKQNIYEHLHNRLDHPRTREILLSLSVYDKGLLQSILERMIRICIDTINQRSTTFNADFLWMVINDLWISRTVVNELEQQVLHEPSSLIRFHLMRAYVLYEKYADAFALGLDLLETYDELSYERREQLHLLWLLTLCAITSPGNGTDSQMMAIAALTIRYVFPHALPNFTLIALNGMIERWGVPEDGLRHKRNSDENICLRNLVVSAWNSVKSRCKLRSNSNLSQQKLQFAPCTDALVSSFEEALQLRASSMSSINEQPRDVFRRLTSNCLESRLNSASHLLTTALAEEFISQDAEDNNKWLVTLECFTSYFDHRLQLLRDCRDCIGNYLCKEQVTEGKKSLWKSYIRFQQANPEMLSIVGGFSEKYCKAHACIYSHQHAPSLRVFSAHISWV